MNRIATAVGSSAPIFMLGLAYLTSVAFNAAIQIGPLDRAKLGWMITMPLMLLAPGLGALGLRFAERRSQAVWLAVAIAAAFALVVTSWRLAVGTTQIGCEPITHWIQALPMATLVGIAAGAALAAAIGIPFLARRGTAATVVLGAVIGFAGAFLVLMTWVLANPAVSCAPRP